MPLVLHCSIFADGGADEIFCWQFISSQGAATRNEEESLNKEADASLSISFTLTTHSVLASHTRSIQSEASIIAEVCLDTNN